MNNNSTTAVILRVIATLLVAGALAAGAAGAAERAGVIRPVTDRDHVRGDPQAPVKIVEFSDTECPLCKRQHPTLQRLVQDYQGMVAWVYRHRPIDAIHPRARKEAEATECAAELGGHDSFWAYLDRLFEITPSNNRLDPAELPRIATHVGLDRNPFEQCLKSGRHAQRVAEDVAEANAAGVPGAPFSVVVAPNGKTFPVAGAQTYESWELVVGIALEQKGP
jgi:protein-disulfide isomerase